MKSFLKKETKPIFIYLFNAPQACGILVLDPGSNLGTRPVELQSPKPQGPWGFRGQLL